MKDLAKVQGEVKRGVDEYLRANEPKSLRYTRVSIKGSGGKVEVNVKIYLEAPIKFSSLVNVINLVSSKLGARVGETYVYSPHSRSLRITIILTP